MTSLEKTVIKRKTQEAVKEFGFKVFQKDMVLLETSTHRDRVLGITSLIIDYVLFEDRKTGKKFRCFYGKEYYNPDKGTLWRVEECVA